MPVDGSFPLRKRQPLQDIQKLGRVDHLDISSVTELIQQRENVIDLALLDPVRRPLSTQEPVRREKPELGFLGGVKLPEFLKKELQGEKSLKVLPLGRYSPGVPTRNGLRCGVEQLGDIASLDASTLPDSLQTFCQGSRHRTSCESTPGLTSQLTF